MNLRAMVAADANTAERQRNCGVVPVGSQVEIRRKHDSAYYCGVETCGNVWLCPVCSAKIRERSAWKKVTAGAAWQRLKRRLGIAGHVIALEFTWGEDHRWHPHYHILLVHDQDLDAGAIARVHAHIHSRLAAACRDFGLREPDPLHGVRIDPNVSGTAAGAYVAKGGDWTPAEEVTRGDLKTGRAGNRTPFQILADHYQTGDLHDRRLLREYSRVTRGLAAVRWSHGLRRRMLGPTAEPGRADEELASEDVNGDLIAVIPLPVWSHIRLAGLEHAVLVAAEHGGLADVNSLIRPTCLRADRPPKSAAAAADPLARSALTTLSARQCSPRPAG